MDLHKVFNIIYGIIFDDINSDIWADKTILFQKLLKYKI